jgi:hypothetical protein
MSSSPSWSAKPLLFGTFRGKIGLLVGGCNVSKFKVLLERRPGVWAMLGVRHCAGAGEGVTLQKSARLKFCPGVCRAPLNNPICVPGVVMTEEGRCECCDGGVEGGSFEVSEGLWKLMAGDREGEFAK